MSVPTLINLPPPPSDPCTPSDMGPGTPNSTQTSLSTLSITAIKDGHKGHPPNSSSHHHRPTHSPHSSTSSTNTLDAERADRISRLAGLERVATARQPLQSYGSGPSGGPPPGQPGYFDNANPYVKERSTVGSASATGSAGGRTTWASESDAGGYAEDKMSESAEGDGFDGVSSAGLSDGGDASLVGFGEAASSVSGTPLGGVGRVGSGRLGGVGSYGEAMQGMHVERGVQGRNANMTGQETAERIVRERLASGGKVTPGSPMEE